MTMTVRGALVGADFVLDSLPAEAFKVRSWSTGCAPQWQAKTRAVLKKSGRTIEPVWDAKRRRYVGLVWVNPTERSYCFREWEAHQS